MKAWYQSKTIWLAVIQGALGICAAVSSANPTLNLAGVVVVLKSVVDIMLRYGTTVPIS